MRGYTKNYKNSLEKELNIDTEVHKFGLGNINFGMRIDYNGVNLLRDPSYFTFTSIV